MEGEAKTEREDTTKSDHKASPGERPARDPGPDMPIQTKRVQVKQLSFS